LAFERGHQSKGNGGFSAAAVGSSYDDASDGFLLKVGGVLYYPRRGIFAENIRIQ
jgi:hypothetical protein